jgi:Tol biopolymer transport system component
MPDFNTRKPQETNEPNRLHIQLVANKLRTLLIATKPRILLFANRVRSLLITNRLRTLLIGGGILLLVVTVPFGPLIYSSSRGLGDQLWEAVDVDPTGEIAFELDDAPRTMNADGSNLRGVSGIDSEIDDLAWSPDLKKIVFMRVVDGDPNSASSCSGGSGCIFPTDPEPYQEMVVEYVVSSAGDHRLAGLVYVLQLDNNAGAQGPAWSPDGKEIAFSRQPDRYYAYPCDIYVMNADGSGTPRRLTPQPKLESNSSGFATSELATSESCDTNPAWSPDGRKIAFASSRTGNGDIYVVNASGEKEGANRPQRLTDSPGVDDQPSWSPDGTEIAFARQVDPNKGDNRDIYKVDADGSGETRLAHPRDPEHSPTWSPDGEQIAFVRQGYLGAPAYSSAIYIMESDGSAPVLVRKFPEKDAENLYWR